MPKYQITGPDGASYEVTAPDGYSEDQVFQVFQENTQAAAEPKGLVREFAGNVVDAGSKLVNGVSDAWNGKQDPKFANVPTLREYGVNDGTSASMFAFSDDAYADVLQKNLGDRFISREKDANGYEIISYRDKKTGEVKQGYVNSPGLDSQDVGRTIDSALPYLAGGFVAGGAAKALGATGMLTNAALQGAGQAGASIGTDVVAAGQGSKQGVDYPRAAAAGTLGGGSQLIPRTWLPAAGASAGGLIGGMHGDTWTERGVNAAAGAITGGIGGKVLKAATKQPNIDKLDNGQLPPHLKAEAKRAGVDLDEITPEQAENFLTSISRGQNATEAASKIQTDTFGIPTTVGQRSKDPAQLLLEKDARFRTLGDDAHQVMKKFDKDQADAIQAAALRPSGGEGDHLSVGAKIAPKRLFAESPNDVTADALGDSVRRNIQDASRQGDELISKAWDGVSKIEPTREGLDLLPKFINDNLGMDAVDDVVTPASAKMLDDLGSYMQGDLALGKRLGNTDGITVRSVDQMRRRLLQQSKTVDPSDARVANKIYGAFNDWIDEVANQAFVKGDPAAAGALRSARAVTKEIKQRLTPTHQGKKTPGGKVIQKIINDADSAEDVVGLLIGRGGPTTAPSASHLQAVRSLKAVLKSPVKAANNQQLARPSAADQTWDDIRLAYWSKLVVNNKGEMFTPTMMINNISAASHKQGAMMRELFSPGEIRLMQQFKGALRQAAYKDPNPSGTASAARKQYNNKNNFVKEALRTQAQRETFSKHNVIMARIYRMLANVMPVSIAGSRDALGRSVAKSATRQTVKALPASQGAIGGLLGVGTTGQ